MAKIKQAVTFRHRVNLGEDLEEVSFDEGAELTVLKEWEDRYLCKDDDGRLFNVPKEYLEA